MATFHHGQALRTMSKEHWHGLAKMIGEYAGYRSDKSMHRYHHFHVYILLATFAILLAQNIAHGRDEQSVVSQDEVVVSTDAVESEVPCPGEDFSVFLAKFVEDETIQREFTMFPLTKLVIDYDSEPDPEVYIQFLPRDQVEFPVFPLRQERADLSLEIRLEHLSDDTAKVAVFIPDTGYLITYSFRKNGCWRLRRIEDCSM
jgi:hypothetical protein